MDFTEGQRKLLAYWGTIRTSVEQRMSTADLWESVKRVAEREGASLRGVRPTDMNLIRSIAAEQRNKRDAFQRLRPTDAVTADVIARDVSARDPASQALAPRYIVRFEHDITVDGQLQTVWRSSVIDGGLPVTVEDIRRQVEEDAQGLADDYDVTHIGVGRIEISAA